MTSTEYRSILKSIVGTRLNRNRKEKTMRRDTLLAVTITLVVLALACGPSGIMGGITGDGDGDESPAVTQPPDDEPVQAPPTDPSGDEPAPPPGDVMKDIPIYPGATIKMGATPPPVPGAAAAYENVEARLYETGDDKDKVCNFYKDEMPKAGWQKILYMPVDEGCITSWLLSDDKTGATIVVAEQSDGKVLLSIVAGKTE